jgi:hypothetical protein
MAQRATRAKCGRSAPILDSNSQPAQLGFTEQVG